MQKITFAFTIWTLILSLVACGGSVNANSDDLNASCPEPGEQEVCGGWIKDESYANLVFEGRSLTSATSMSLLDSSVFVTTQNTDGRGVLAKKGGGKWSAQGLPSEASHGLMLKANTDKLYMSALSQTGKPLLFSFANGVWSSISLPEKAKKVEVVAVRKVGAICILTVDDFGGHSLYCLFDNGWQSFPMPQKSNYVVKDAFITVDENVVLLMETDNEPHCQVVQIDLISTSYKTLIDSPKCVAPSRLAGTTSDDIWVSGRNEFQRATIWHLDTLNGNLKAFVNSNIRSYSPLVQIGPNRVLTAGNSGPHLTDQYGGFVNLWSTDLFEDLSYNGKDGFYNETSTLVEEFSTGPIDIVYDSQKGESFILTSEAVYTRHCIL